MNLKYQIMRAAAALFMVGAVLGLGGCDTIRGVTNVIGGCPIPAQYDVHKPDPKDFVAVDPQGHASEVADGRHQAKQDVDDFNGFHDYVASKCK